MEKLVKLSLEGQLDLGYKVELVEIKEDGKDGRILAEGVLGTLPPAYQIYQDYRRWQEIYSHLGPVGWWKKPGNEELPTEISVEACQQAADMFKKSFNEWLDSREFQRIENTLRTKLNEGERIRFIIKTTDENLWKFPWGVWDFFENYSKAEVAFSRTEFGGVEKTVASRRRKQVRIIGLGSDRRGTDYERDEENLRLLRAAGAEQEFINEPTPREVRDALEKKKWDIFFFVGASDSQGQALNISDIIAPEDLESTLKTAIGKGLKIAILNSCDGLDLARKMVTDFGMPLVIAMREPVPNKFAKDFIKYFMIEYACKKQPLYIAVRQARERIADEWRARLPGIDWLPLICQNPAIRPPTWADLHRPVSIKQVGVSALACTSLMMLARFLGLLQPLELGAFDHLMRLRPDAGPDKRLLVVEVTEGDLQQYGYPISDRTMASLLEKLMQYQPFAVGLDIYRPEPLNPGYAQFAAHLQKNSRFITICKAGDPRAKDDNKIGVNHPPASPIKNVGFGNIAVDPRGIVRRHLFGMTRKSTCPVPYALSTQLALRYLWVKGIKLQQLTPEKLQLDSAVFKPLKKHTGFYHKIDVRGDEVLLNYRSPKKVAEQVTLTDVLEGRLGLNSIKDRIVLIGVTAPSFGERFYTPYGAAPNEQMPGVLVHAQMVSQTISAALGERPLLWFFPVWGDVLWVGFWSLVGSLVIWRWRSPLHQGLAGGVALVTLYGVCFVVLLTKGGCLPLVPSALALVATGGSVAIFTASQTQLSISQKIKLAN